MNTTNTFTIDVARDFSVIPSGRFHKDSPDCAEALFIMINDCLDYHDHINVKFDNLLQVGSSFLAHLSRMIINNHINKRVTISSDDEWVMRRYNKYYDYYYEQWRYGQ